MRFTLRGATMCALLATAAACASRGAAGGSSASAQATPAIPIPANSPLAKIKVGMASDEVFATIGQPTAQNQYQTGKAWIPFHFGGDNFRTDARYKGLGVVVFSQNNAFTKSMTVIDIKYDPAEPGFEKKK